MEWFRQYENLNRDVDLSTLKTNDNVTKIKYLYDGKEYTITPLNLLKRKNINAKPQAPRRYCADDKAFMQWFDKNADLNPDFDPKKVSVNTHCHIKYHTDGGPISTALVSALFRPGKFSAPRNKPRKCWDDPDFRSWFETNRELNPDIDPTSLSFCDCKTRLYYHPRDSLEVYSISPSGLYVKKDRYARPYSHGGKRAITVPGFKEWFERYKELNPGVDLDSLFEQGNDRLKYLTGDGQIATVSVRELCSTLEPEKLRLCMDDPDFREWIDEYAWLNSDVDISSLTTLTQRTNLKYLHNGKIRLTNPYMLFQRKDLLSQLGATIRDDPLFWDYCVETEKKLVGSYSKNNNSRKFKMLCSNGHSFEQTPRIFYKYANQGRDPCPFCDGRAKTIPGVNDAATADPELVLFYSKDNEKMLNTISPLDGHDNYKMECPYCGHKFTRTMKNIAGKHPKCPNCKDNGAGMEKKEINYMPEGIPFLIPEDEILNAKKRIKNGGLQKDRRAPAEGREQT